jgi:NAD(P)H-dependent FMN reductase
MKTVTIINGARRAGGNTDRLVKILFDSALESGLNLHSHVLRNLRIDDCAGCYHCYKNPGCSRKDDMEEIHQHLQASDLLVLASPMYWWGFTGLTKTFINRLYLYYPENNASRVRGKKAIVLMPMHVNPREHGLEAYKSEIQPVTLTIKYIFRRLKMEVIGIRFYPGLTGRHDLKNCPGFLDITEKLGKNLGNCLPADKNIPSVFNRSSHNDCRMGPRIGQNYPGRYYP